MIETKLLKEMRVVPHIEPFTLTEIYGKNLSKNTKILFDFAMSLINSHDIVLYFCASGLVGNQQVKNPLADNKKVYIFNNGDALKLLMERFRNAQTTLLLIENLASILDDTRLCRDMTYWMRTRNYKQTVVIATTTRVHPNFHYNVNYSCFYSNKEIITFLQNCGLEDYYTWRKCYLKIYGTFYTVKQFQRQKNYEEFEHVKKIYRDSKIQLLDWMINQGNLPQVLCNLVLSYYTL